MSRARTVGRAYFRRLEQSAERRPQGHTDLIRPVRRAGYPGPRRHAGAEPGRGRAPGKMFSTLPVKTVLEPRPATPTWPVPARPTPRPVRNGSVPQHG